MFPRKYSADIKPMIQQLMRWKKVECKSAAGKILTMDFPSEIDELYRGTLLTRIMSMACKTPISLSEAINLMNGKLHAAFRAGRVRREPGHYYWYLDNFVEWISDQGFHIEITGDEFEPTNRWNI